MLIVINGNINYFCVVDLLLCSYNFYFDMVLLLFLKILEKFVFFLSIFIILYKNIFLC